MYFRVFIKITFKKYRWRAYSLNCVRILFFFGTHFCQCWWNDIIRCWKLSVSTWSALHRTLKILNYENLVQVFKVKKVFEIKRGFRISFFCNVKIYVIFTTFFKQQSQCWSHKFELIIEEPYCCCLKLSPLLCLNLWWWSLDPLYIEK